MEHEAPEGAALTQPGEEVVQKEIKAPQHLGEPSGRWSHSLQGIAQASQGAKTTKNKSENSMTMWELLFIECSNICSLVQSKVKLNCERLP